MTATATHDTKRGEDARARMLAISELAEDWVEAVRQLAFAQRPSGRRPRDARAPSRLHEYMIYQTLIGAWPLEGPDAEFADRMQAYALKAAREGKVETSWTNPDEATKTRSMGSCATFVDPAQSGEFIDSFQAVCGPHGSARCAQQPGATGA